MTKSPQKPAPRAYSYLRFSTAEQAKGDSLRRQTALADEYAKRHGLTLDTELKLRDLGVSAYRGDNVALGALGAFLQAVRDGLVPKGSVLLVEALDRISRKVARKAVRILEEIIEADVPVVTLNDGKMYTVEGLDGMDFVLAILLFMRGAEESETKSRRLKESWKAKRERAARGGEDKIQTAAVPAWIKVIGSAAKDSRDARLSLIPDRAKLVQRIFEMYAAGEGKHAIAETFNAEKIATWGGSEYWHSSYISKILRSPTVTGRLVPHVECHVAGKRLRAPQPAILDYYPRAISEEMFERVQTLITARRGKIKSASIRSLVAGLARCPKCGGTMTRVFKGAGPKAGIPKLVCAKAKTGKKCKYHLVKLPEIEQAFVRHAAYLGKPPIVVSSLTEDIHEASDGLALAVEQIGALVDTIEKRPSVALSKRLQEREAQAAALRDQLKELRTRAADSESRVVSLRAKRLADALRNLSPATLAAANAALRECLESVTVDYNRGDLRLAWRHGPVTELEYDSGFEDLEKAAARPGGRR